MLQVVKPACQFTQDLGEAVIVIESDITEPNYGLAIEELSGAGAKQLAVAYATQNGCSPCACKPHGAGAYPINSEGMPLEQVHDEQNQPLPPQHPRMQVARYRVDVPIARRLI